MTIDAYGVLGQLRLLKAKRYCEFTDGEEVFGSHALFPPFPYLSNKPTAEAFSEAGACLQYAGQGPLAKQMQTQCNHNFSLWCRMFLVRRSRTWEKMGIGLGSVMLLCRAGLYT